MQPFAVVCTAIIHTWQVSVRRRVWWGVIIGVLLVAECRRRLIFPWVIRLSISRKGLDWMTEGLCNLLHWCLHRKHSRLAEAGDVSAKSVQLCIGWTPFTMRVSRLAGLCWERSELSQQEAFPNAQQLFFLQECNA